MAARDWLGPAMAVPAGFARCILTRPCRRRTIPPWVARCFFREPSQCHAGVRIGPDGEWLIAGVNAVSYDFAFERYRFPPRCLAAYERLMLAARASPCGRSNGQARCCAGGTFRSPADRLTHLLGALGDVRSGLGRRATALVDGIEDGSLARRTAGGGRNSPLRSVLVAAACSRPPALPSAC